MNGEPNPVPRVTKSMAEDHITKIIKESLRKQSEHVDGLANGHLTDEEYREVVTDAVDEYLNEHLQDAQLTEQCHQTLSEFSEVDQ